MEVVQNLRVLEVVVGGSMLSVTAVFEEYMYLFIHPIVACCDR